VDKATESKFDDVFHQLDTMNSTISKVFDRLDKMLVITVKNTTILKEHHARSTGLEDISKSMNDQIQQTTLEVARIHADIKPIKQHVKNMRWLAILLEATPMIMKITASIVTIISAGAGAYYTFVYLLR